MVIVEEKGIDRGHALECWCGLQHGGLTAELGLIASRWLR
jgi:hypothetical protein